MQAVVIFALVAPAALAWKAGVLACVGCVGGGNILHSRKLPTPNVSQARRLLSRLRSVPCVGCVGGGNFTAVAPAALAWNAGGLACVGCVGEGFFVRTKTLPPPSVSQARRLLSRLRSVLPSSWVAGETPALRAAQRSPFLLGRRRDACSPGCAAFSLPPRKLPPPSVSQARRGCVEPEALFVDSPGF